MGRKKIKIGIDAKAAIYLVMLTLVTGFLLFAPAGRFMSAAVAAGAVFSSPSSAAAAVANGGKQQNLTGWLPGFESFGPGGTTADIWGETQGLENLPTVTIATKTGTAPSGFMPIKEMQYTAEAGEKFLPVGAALLRNQTKLPREEVTAEILAGLPFKVELNSSEPQVLIMHTHATESYQDNDFLYYDPAYTCRTTNTNSNMVRIGAEMAKVLNDMGINTIQSTTLHDYPSYNGSYAESKKTVEKLLAQYPSIKIVLDVHRDAIEYEDGTRVKPVTMVNGLKAAQVMIICGADNGAMNMPNYKQNLRFATAYQNAIETVAPTLTRPILFDYRNYNQQLTTGSILVEVGGHANTLNEAIYAAKLCAQALGNLLKNA